MARSEKPDVAVVSSKGQVVIPQSIREKLKIKPKSKLLVYGYQDAIVIKKLEVPDVERELREIVRQVDKSIEKYGELTEKQIQREIEAHRRAKRKT